MNERLLKVGVGLTAVNTVLMLVLVALALRGPPPEGMDDGPLPADVVAPPDAQPPGPASGQEAGPDEVVEAYFEVTLRRLETEVTAQGLEPAEVIPGPSLIGAAISSGDLRSADAQTAMAALREGYAKVGLEFPEPPPESPPGDDGPPPDKAPGVE
jgi:hypothetical protein